MRNLIMKSILDWKVFFDQKCPGTVHIKTIKPQAKPISILSNVSDGIHPYFDDKYLREISKNVSPLIK